MTGFDDREKAFENRYARDQETRFRIIARRNKLLGLWAAEHMGITGADADAYARQVVESDFEKPGDEDVFDKVNGDFKARGIEMSEHRIRREMTSLLDVAREQIEKG